jgi:DNA-binding transcriptional ArsR family regulator
MKAVVAPVLANPARQEIMALLYLAPRTPSELAAVLGLSQSYISNLLAALKGHRLVTSERSGRKVLYDLDERVRIRDAGAQGGAAAGAQ